MKSEVQKSGLYLPLRKLQSAQNDEIEYLPSMECILIVAVRLRTAAEAGTIVSVHRVGLHPSGTISLASGETIADDFMTVKGELDA